MEGSRAVFSVVLLTSLPSCEGIHLEGARIVLTVFPFRPREKGMIDRTLFIYIQYIWKTEVCFIYIEWYIYEKQKYLSYILYIYEKQQYLLSLLCGCLWEPMPFLKCWNPIRHEACTSSHVVVVVGRQNSRLFHAIHRGLRNKTQTKWSKQNKNHSFIWNTLPKLHHASDRSKREAFCLSIPPQGYISLQ